MVGFCVIFALQYNSENQLKLFSKDDCLLLAIIGLNSDDCFVTARRYASAVLAVVVCPSVCPSVCLSVCLSVCPSVTSRYCVKTTARSMVQFGLSNLKCV